MSNNILTIGIPTYRRPEALKRALKSIFDLSKPDLEFQVLIIDDSGDKEFRSQNRKVIENLKRFGRVNLIEHQENRGYAYSLIELFSNCKTEYILLSADDDLIDITQFSKLYNFLIRYTPDIVSTQYFRKGVLYRGSSATCKARPHQFRKVNSHAPGVVYNVAQARDSSASLLRLLEGGNIAAEVYPQVVITIDTFMRGGSIWHYAGAFVTEGGALKSQIKDKKGNHYADLASRIQQFADFDALILSYPESPERSEILRGSRTSALNLCLKADDLLFSGVLDYHSERLLIVIWKKILSRFKKLNLLGKSKYLP